MKPLQLVYPQLLGVLGTKLPEPLDSQELKIKTFLSSLLRSLKEKTFFFSIPASGFFTLH